MTETRIDRRPTRRMGAEARALKRAEMSAEERLELAKSRPGNSAKEVEKLTPPESPTPPPGKTGPRHKK